MERRTRIIHGIAWLAFGLSVFAAIEAAYANSLSLYALQHADFLYLPMLFNDVVLSGGSVADWAMPPSPYLFPDFAIYGLLRIVSSRQEWATIGSMAFLTTSVALTCSLLAREAGARILIVPTLALLCLHLLAWARGATAWATGMLCLSNHGGQALIALSCFALLINPTRIRMTIVTVLVFATTMSDPLFCFTAVVPIFFLAWAFEPRWKVWVFKLVTLAAATAAGLISRRWLPISPPRGATIDFGRSRDALNAFVSHLGDVDAYPLYAGFALSVVALAVSWRTPKRRMIVVALWLSILGTLSGLWLIGAEVVTWGSRYLVLTHLAVFILAPIGLESIFKRLPVTAVVALGALTLALTTAFGLRAGALNVGRLKTVPVDCFESTTESADAQRCVASYWFAKPLAVMSKRPLQVTQIGAGGVTDWWISTRGRDADGRSVDCAVFHDADAAAFSSRFGAATSKVSCGDYQLLFYKGAQQQALNERLQPFLKMEQTRRN